jgi:ferredoxin-type protein NapG/ferredoxin-type protein NapH
MSVDEERPEHDQEHVPSPEHEPAPTMGRRDLFRSIFGEVVRAGGTVGLVAGVLSLREGQEAAAGMRGDLGIVRPPGSQDENEFLASCVRCTRCADACKAQCISFFGPEAGKLQGTPYILTADRACTLCMECGPACPSEAIAVLPAMEDADMGVALVDERLCVSHNGTGVCGACHTVCPLKNRAITQNFRNAPEVHADACSGCGLCEEVCIVRDRRAIRVISKRNSNAVTAPEV